MAAQSSRNLTLTRWLLGRRRSSRQQGFTLTELLVSLIVGTLIMGSLLYLVVELLGMNLREDRLTQVQQDTRRALDYISRDVREAVFVYADPTAVTGTDGITDTPSNSTPVLAFWKLRDIRILEPNATGSRTALGTCPANRNEECEILRLRHSVYDLVVYFVRENQPGDIWSGPNRLVRYELTAYSHLGNLTSTDGYRDPSLPGNSFENWTRDGTSTQGNSAVLTDSIDAHDANAGAACLAGLTQTPPGANNFFTCVDAETTRADDNKTIVLFLRGSIAQNDGGGVTFGPVGEGSRLPTLSTEVQVRGVLGRNRQE